MYDESAPSRAKISATARPIPESPPVMRATLSCNFPAGLYSSAAYRGRGLELRLEAGAPLVLLRKRRLRLLVGDQGCVVRRAHSLFLSLIRARRSWRRAMTGKRQHNRHVAQAVRRAG